MKTRHKITLLFSFLVTAILLVVSITVYYFTFLVRQDIFIKRLNSRANNNAQVYSYMSNADHEFLDRINKSSMEVLPEKTVEIYDKQGTLRYHYTTPPHDSAGVTKDVINSAMNNGRYFYKVGYREAVAVNFVDSGERFVVVVAAYDVDGWTLLKRLKRIFFISLLLGMIISLLAGHFFSLQLLKPVAQIISEVNDISSHNLSHRIKAGASQDELNQLANTFNDLLDRLQEYFTAQRRFISNASHELSTPLTSISSQLEVTMQRTRSTEEYQQVMQSVHEDVVQMRQLTKSLLEIAKTGSEGSIELHEIRIDEVLFKVMADMKKTNSLYQVELNFSDPGEFESNFLVFGNVDLLYIAIKNIVENGCKYSPDHTSRVDLSFRNNNTIIEVRSKGKPIAPDDIEKIFQPFYRSSTSEGKSGFGLGLALAKRIIGLNKGSLAVTSDEENGTIFTIRIPTYFSREN
ncbi:MAG: HAMP domain-containing histidine kinase [Chitinophagaceae bacterium]|nr:HAMP domain-containing histidine kinase [Chitinophagaceae bacterium]